MTKKKVFRASVSMKEKQGGGVAGAAGAVKPLLVSGRVEGKPGVGER